MIKESIPYVSKFVFTLISLALALAAFALILFHFWDVVRAITSGKEIEKSLIEAVEYIVIGLAIFDVSRFVLEEEVIADRVEHSLSRTRNKISRFMVVIIVAIALESLLKILGAQTTGNQSIVISAILLVVDALLIIGLGVYLKLSAQAEATVLNNKLYD